MKVSLFFSPDCPPSHLDDFHRFHPLEDAVAAQHHEVLLAAQSELFDLGLSRDYTGCATKTL